MPGPDGGALDPVFGSQELQRALQEAAWAPRLLLRLDASVIFLDRAGGQRLLSAAWHGREAEGLTLDSQSSPIRALRAGRRSVSWDSRLRCPDGELGGMLDAMGLCSGLLVPLTANGRPVGIWLAAAAAERSYTANDELIMATLAENISLTTESMILAAENVRYRREADALYEIAKEISQLMDLDQVLRLVAQKVCALLTCEISYIALADDDAEEVRVRVTEGTRNEYLRTMVLKYGEGVGGWVASNRKPLLVDDYPSPRWPKPPGIEYIAATEDIVSIIAVPMVTRRGLVGVLFAADRRKAVFNQSQVNLLMAMAAQAAIAIENARLYAEQVAALEKLQTNTTTGQQLLALVLGNQGLSTIANTVCELVGCPVAVYDNRFHLLCHSAPGAAEAEGRGRVGPVGWLDVELRERLDLAHKEGGVVRLPARPDRNIAHARTAVRVSAGNRLLGYAVVLEMEHALNEQQSAALEQASLVLALEFMKQEAAQAVEQRLAGDLLDDLLFEHVTPDGALYQRAARFNVDLNCPHRVVVVDVDGFADAVKKNAWSDVEALAVKRRLMGAVTDALRRTAAGGLVGMRGDSVLVLVPQSSMARLHEAKALARVAHQSISASLPGLTVSIGIGSEAWEPASFARSYADALMALRSAGAAGRTNCVVALEDLGVLPLLLQSGNQQALLAFRERFLRPLLNYDAEREGQLVTTLTTYLANSGNLRRTAEDCHIHLNSLKYRLRRIHEITGLDLDDGQTRFNAQLALSIHAALQVLQ